MEVGEKVVRTGFSAWIYQTNKKEEEEEEGGGGGGGGGRREVEGKEEEEKGSGGRTILERDVAKTRVTVFFFVTSRRNVSSSKTKPTIADDDARFLPSNPKLPATT